MIVLVECCEECILLNELLTEILPTLSLFRQFAVFALFYSSYTDSSSQRAAM